MEFGGLRFMIKGDQMTKSQFQPIAILKSLAQSGQRWRKCLLAASLLLSVTAAAACMPGLAPIVMPESPLIPGTNTALVENRFRVVEIIWHGELVAFDAIHPVYITFDERGELSKQTKNCNSGVYAIVAESERQYRLIPGAGTAKGCGELAEAQYDRISEAIGATTEYELRGSQLLLHGDGVYIVLEVDNQP
jgi:hypothetical protein